MLVLPVRAGEPDHGRGAPAVEAAPGTDMAAPIRKHKQDLPWRREFGFVAGEDDPLAFFFAEAVRHMAVATITSDHAICVRS